MIVAHDQDLAIGSNNNLLWPHGSQKADMNMFKKVTTGKTVIMGRKTWDSIPKKFRPLPNRFNIVVSRDADVTKTDDLAFVNSKEMALEVARETNNDVFIIGGAQIYEMFLKDTELIHVTRIAKLYLTADTYMPDYHREFYLVSEERHDSDKDNIERYDFEIWRRLGF